MNAVTACSYSHCLWPRFGRCQPDTKTGKPSHGQNLRTGHMILDEDLVPPRASQSIYCIYMSFIVVLIFIPRRSLLPGSDLMTLALPEWLTAWYKECDQLICIYDMY